MLKSIKSAGKFKKDLFWNLLSFILAGISGLLLNVIVLYYAGYESLGEFNQVYAFYIVASQVCSLGVHLSILRFIPDPNFQEERRVLLTSSALTIAFGGVLLLFLLYLIIKFTALNSLYDANVINQVINVIPGVYFFIINKVLLSYLIALRRMKLFAWLNFLRYLLILLFAFIFLFTKVDVSQSLVFGELIVFLYLILKLFRDFSIEKKVYFWCKKHLIYGIKSFLGNLFMDVSAQVDVLILGLFINSKMVGVYGFSAFCITGFKQINVVFRNNFNPLITKLYSPSNPKVLSKFIEDNRRKVLKVFVFAGFIALLSFPMVLFVLDRKSFWVESTIIFSVLLIGVVLTSGYSVFYLLFNQLGKPIIHSKFSFGIALSNIVLNFALIPLLGGLGAAIATTVSMLFSTALFKFFIRRTFNLK